MNISVACCKLVCVTKKFPAGFLKQPVRQSAIVWHNPKFLSSPQCWVESGQLFSGVWVPVLWGRGLVHAVCACANYPRFLGDPKNNEYLATVTATGDLLLSFMHISQDTNLFPGRWLSVFITSHHGSLNPFCHSTTRWLRFCWRCLQPWSQAIWLSTTKLVEVKCSQHSTLQDWIQYERLCHQSNLATHWTSFSHIYLTCT